MTSSGYFSCVSASGKWLSSGPSEKTLEAFKNLPEAERKPGAVKVPPLDPGDRTIIAPPEGGLVLRVHGRFLARDDKGQLRHVAKSDFPLVKGNIAFLLEPNTEYMWLTAAEVQSLVPAKPAKGDRIFVQANIAERIARFHLSPRRALTSEDGIIPKSALKQATLTLLVDDITPERIKLSAHGFVRTGSEFDPAKATSPNGPLPFGYATALHGILEYDRVKKTFIRFDMIAPGDVWGRWGDANGNSQTIERPGRNPIGFAFELAAGTSPTDRLPPAGHGGRAIRAGYFGTSE